MKRGGFPGMGGKNMNQMMKQMKKMQREMEEMQSKMEEEEIEFSSGGGIVVVKVNGKKELLSVTIDPEAVDPDDVDMLEDLIVAAVNGALIKADEKSNAAIQAMTGGLNIPGL